MTILLFQSTHPLRGATAAGLEPTTAVLISIHAPLAGCDRTARFPSALRRDFNPRTPCGVRLLASICNQRPLTFQSTHPLRGATPRVSDVGAMLNISIHAPLAGCDNWSAPEEAAILDFNPRTPCGVRLFTCLWHWTNRKFQSTHPLRGATYHLRYLRIVLHISIHAPLAGCDNHSVENRKRIKDFNPRTPCGVRLS